MNILFLSIVKFWTVNTPGIYTDLIRTFIKHGHHVTAVSPTEKREGRASQVIDEGQCRILKVRTGNIQKANIFEKGISTLLIENQFLKAIKTQNLKFDLVLYPTPPVTFVNVVEHIKKRDSAKTYLMLKDIFPQNAVDIGMLKEGGFVHRYFRYKEKKLYQVSDFIGCMSQANCDYLIKHNPDVSPNKVEICPNSLEVNNIPAMSTDEKIRVRKLYNIPSDMSKKIFICGGNFGPPQGVPFIVECLKAEMDDREAHFVIAGDGIEYKIFEEFCSKHKPENVTLTGRLSSEKFEELTAACDVGLIFLDKRFTIPNFPSRLLSYMQARLPVIACTDTNTDIGSVVESGGFGWKCESSRVENFTQIIQKALKSDLELMGEAGHEYLAKNYSSESCYKTIMQHFS